MSVFFSTSHSFLFSPFPFNSSSSPHKCSAAQFRGRASALQARAPSSPPPPFPFPSKLGPFPPSVPPLSFRRWAAHFPSFAAQCPISSSLPLSVSCSSQSDADAPIQQFLTPTLPPLPPAFPLPSFYKSPRVHLTDTNTYGTFAEVKTWSPPLRRPALMNIFPTRPFLSRPLPPPLLFFFLLLRRVLTRGCISLLLSAVGALSCWLVVATSRSVALAQLFRLLPALESFLSSLCYLWQYSMVVLRPSSFFRRQYPSVDAWPPPLLLDWKFMDCASHS